MTLSVNEITALVGGTLLSGNPQTPIQGVASLIEAQPGDLSFFANPKYLPDLKKTFAGAVFVKPDVEVSISGALIAVENPSLAFTTLMAKFCPEPPLWKPGIHPTAVIGENCQISPTASIQPHAVIESGVKIGAGSVIGAGCYLGHGSILGDNCLIYPNVTIRERTEIGHRVVIHSGSVIGSDGYGFELVAGRHQKIPQSGIVQLDNDVEIGANNTIDRARFGRTWIGEGTKIDNLCHIAHNVVIGRHCLIVAKAGISGSTQLGDYVVLAGSVGVAGHVKIGDRAIVGGGSGVTKSIPAGEKWFGFYAEPYKQMAEKLALISRLPQLFARLKILEKALEKSTSGAPK